jgi:hypothetical protein
MFRVGLLFSTSSPDLSPGAIASVTRVLHEIAATSAGERQGQPVTLVPFIRSVDMATFAQAAAGQCAVEAASFDEAGVVFDDLSSFVEGTHPPFEGGLDFDLGLRVLLSRCDVMLVVCANADELAEARVRIEALRNVAALFALIQLKAGKPEYFEIDPGPTAVDEPSWVEAITTRWGLPSEPLPAAKRTWLGRLFPHLSSLAIGRPTETVKQKGETAAERCRSGMGYGGVASKKLAEPDRQALGDLADGLCPLFDRHDLLGNHYANVFRTTCVLVPFLIGVSTVLAAASALVPAFHDLGHILEGAFLLIALLLYGRTWLRHHHRKWVEHRLLTELIRPTLLHALFHTGPSLTPPPESPERWIDRSRAALRHLRALPTTPLATPKADLLSARITAIGNFARYQAVWHHDFAKQHHTAEKRLTTWSTRAFVITLAFCAFQLGVSWMASPADHGSGHAPIDAGILHVVTLLTVAVATSAFFVSLLVHQLGFAAISERSSSAEEQFSALAKSIEDRPDPDARRAYRWADQLAHAILVEQLSWYRQIPGIQFHL